MYILGKQLGKSVKRDLGYGFPESSLKADLERKLILDIG